MRRTLLATLTVLVTINLLTSPTVQTQQPEQDQFPKPHNREQDKFPKPETYPPAGANCKDKRKLEPWLGTPDVSTGKSRCVLSFYNCQTDKTDVYQSGPRESGTVSLDCSDYLRAKEALGNIEICCDPKCEKPATPWFDRGEPGYSGPECKNRQPIRTTIDTKGFVFLYMCGLPVFVHDAKKEKWPRYGQGTNIEAYERALRRYVIEKVGPYVCCDSFNASVRPGSSCDPRFDLDCDGTSNGTDRTEDGRFPDITTFAVGPGIPIKDTDPHLSCFIPPSPNECDCKWELMQGTRQRSRGLNVGKYNYEGRWRCPSTGKEIVVSDSRFGHERCEQGLQL
jgi:hypothetical protein